MKLHLFIPPAISLLIAGWWLIPQAKEITHLESTVAHLTKTARPDRTHPNPPTHDLRDWKKSAVRLSNELSDQQRKEFDGQLKVMSRRDLLAVLLEMEATELSEAEKSLARSYLRQLFSLDPQLTFDQFGGHLFDQTKLFATSLRFCFGGWAKSDPASATAWLDQQIVDGKFESQNPSHDFLRRILENHIFHGLLVTHPQQAAARLESYTHEQRKFILSSFYQVPEDEQIGYATLIRSSFSPEDATVAFSHFIEPYAIGPQLSKSKIYEQATAAMNRIDASPAERETMIQAAIPHTFRDIADQGTVTIGDLDEFRQWCDAEAPAITAKLTGEVLAAAVTRSENLHYAEAAEMIMSYHQSDPSDETITRFLEGESTPDYPEIATQLAGLISDESLRREWIERLQPDSSH
ncbi:hypothetical protein JIN85_13860 [Luteolibacter pohnpeiensis]|uniref:Uncharacterized protein n=1 Tax=Luteolibacter pohnpeiensis TaxID=454153 RepID=A0A934VX64_9BACT|nr:hypothetical protein [Luteolibacter pohnpeiensis]MBK1883508.1 hypothetical protein [Luteolibacter pohnpeiensis]